MQTLTLTIAILALAWTASAANAQHSRHGNRHHGVRHHGGVVHHNRRHVIPHYNVRHSGSYYSTSGQSFYIPQTVGHGPAPAPVAVQFGGFVRVEDLTDRLEGLLNDLCLDLHYNYPHNHGFRETYTEAYQILQIAKFIHGAEHSNDRDAIAAKIGGLDVAFHHIQEDVRGWSRHHHRQVGRLGILTKMEYIESTIHHLMNDVGVRAAPQGPGTAPVPAPGGGVEQAPPPRI